MVNKSIRFRLLKDPKYSLRFFEIYVICRMYTQNFQILRLQNHGVVKLQFFSLCHCVWNGLEANWSLLNRFCNTANQFRTIITAWNLYMKCNKKNTSIGKTDKLQAFAQPNQLQHYYFSRQLLFFHVPLHLATRHKRLMFAIAICR